MSENNSTKKEERNWFKIVSSIIGMLIGIGGFIFGGGWFYNHVYNAPVLSYTILQNYDLGTQYFSGLVIENRGRVQLTNIDVTIANLQYPIQSLNLPGLNPGLSIATGGVGNNNVGLINKRLFPGESFSIYLVTGDSISLEESSTFTIFSEEVKGTPSQETIGPFATASLVVSVFSFALGGFTLWNTINLGRLTKKRKEKELDLLLRAIEAKSELDEVTKLREEVTSQYEEAISQYEEANRKYEEAITLKEETKKELKETNRMLKEAIALREEATENQETSAKSSEYPENEDANLDAK